MLEQMSVKNITSVWWAVTAYSDLSGTWDDIALVEDKAKWPPWIDEIRGGRETCPTTGRLHYQAALKARECVRMAKVKSWLKHSHITKSDKTIALKQYVMKEETAAGPKTIVMNPNPYFSADEICLEIARACRRVGRIPTDQPTDRFWRGVRGLLAENPRIAGQLMNPSLKNFYVNTESVWIQRAQTMDVVHSITCPLTAAEEARPCNGRDECCCQKCCPEVEHGEDSPQSSP